LISPGIPHLVHTSTMPSVARAQSITGVELRCFLLSQAAAAAPRKHPFVFIGFYGEERGLVGSAHCVHEAGKEKLTQIDAMVNLDAMGLGPTSAWVSHADPNLAKLAFALASAMKLPLSGINVERVGSTDSGSFREKKVPSIAFSSLTQETLPILHTIRDQLSQIKEDDYYESYKFLSAYLVYLDNAVPERVVGASAGRQKARCAP